MGKISLIAEQLKKAVSVANRFVANRPNLPVLGNVLIEAEKARVFFTATNLESTVRLSVPAKSEQNWGTTVPARTLSEFVTNLTSEETELTLEKDTLTIKGGSLKANLATIASNEFPKLPETKSKEEEEIDINLLSEAVGKVIFSASADEAKPVMTGILLYSENNHLNFVATDGYRLSKKETTITAKLDKLVIPAKILAESLKVARDLGENKVSLSFSEAENQLLLKGETFLIYTRLLDGTYPQFSQIIPTDFKSTVRVKKEELVTALRAASVFAQDLGNVVKLNLEKGKLLVTANTAQVGDGEAEVNAKAEGGELKIAFNSRFLLDGLNAIEAETIVLEFSGPLSPTLVRAEEDRSFIYVVMPVKVQN